MCVCVQVQPLHSSACCCCPDKLQSGGSSCRDSSWQQHYSSTQSAWHHHHHMAGPNLSSSSSSSGSLLPLGARAFSSSSTPSQQAAVAHSADTASEAAETSSDRRPALHPAADPKPILGVCRRKNVKCGWKKIDFVLRMVSHPEDNLPSTQSVILVTQLWQAAIGLPFSRCKCSRVTAGGGCLMSVEARAQAQALSSMGAVLKASLLQDAVRLWGSRARGQR